MKTPQQEKNENLNKDGKPDKDAAKARPPRSKPGFAMAKAELRRDATWTAQVKCVNGNPGNNPASDMPRGTKYYGGAEEIPSPSDISVYLPDSQNIDSSCVFPWSYTLPDPLRLGGGIVKGTVHEGAQRAISSEAQPIQAPFIKTMWVNGTPWVVDFFIDDTFGLTLYNGDVVFGLAIMDPVSGKLHMRAMAKSEGDCI